MGEIWMPVGGRNVITLRLEPEHIHGRNRAGQPILYLGLRLQLLPAGEQKDTDYTLLRLTGQLLAQGLGEFASFEADAMAELPHSEPYFRQKDVLVTFDRQRAERFETVRNGNDAHFQITFTGLVWCPRQQKFEVMRGSSGQMDIAVPRSQWIEHVLSPWGIWESKVIELSFPSGSAGENYRNSYARIEEAEKLFASGQYKQVLTTLRLSFEGLAKSLQFPAAGKDFFESLFTSVHPDKREKARDALNGIYRFLHLGPHEQANHPNSNSQAVVTRQDARLALILSQAVFEYITSKN